jgi:hypothetical protein
VDDQVCHLAMVVLHEFNLRIDDLQEEPGTSMDRRWRYPSWAIGNADFL